MPVTKTFSKSNLIEHKVWNELDSHGQTIGLPRLDNERNAEYKQRLFNVFIDRADSSYLGLIYGITRELGLALTKVFTITPTNSADFPYASIFFKDTRCCVYKNYYDLDEIPTEIDKYSLALNSGYTLKELKDEIEAVKYDVSGTDKQVFTVTNETGINLSQRSATIFEQNSIKQEEREILSGQGKTIALNNKNLIKDSEYIFERKFKKRVDSDPAAKGEYKVDYTLGVITSFEEPSSGSYISYSYRNDSLEVYSSPVIINNLQNQYFRKKMFEQVLQDDGVSYESGKPNVFGADIINELFSVYPTTYKE